MTDAEARARREARRLAWTVRIGSWLFRLLAMTWRVRRVDPALFDAAIGGGRPAVFVLTHGHILPLVWQHRGKGVAVLISEHRDGEIIARIAERLGFRTIRGSTSRRAGRALVECARWLEQGGQLAITPDGPRGPAGSFAPGALIAAQRTGAAVFPVAAAARRAWRLRSWDRFLIPKPFARVTIVYGAPEHVGSADARSAVEEAPRFAAYLAAAIERAETLDSRR